MTPRRARAWRIEQLAHFHLVDLFEADELDFTAIMTAIGICSAALADSEAVREIEDASARAEVLLLLDRAFW